MLFTRCPHCNTTFRITADALGKAGGQVRCGRCVNIFDAYAELREEADDAAQATPAREDTPVEPPAAPAAMRDSAAEAEAAAEAETTFPAPALETPATEAEAPAEATQSAAPPWLADEAKTSEPTRSPRLWGLAAGLALLALVAQVTHHFRWEFASQPLIGPLVQNAYAILGTPVLPRWNIAQYRVLDWVATAEPSPNGEGTLAINARIRNVGPDAQPFPHVLVQLKDRWESAIGSRVFAPREYLASAPANGALMAAGDTANAALTLVDPGPDAYGFEIDVCIELGEEQLRCQTDRVFE